MAAAGTTAVELPCGLFKFCCAMFLRVARAPAMLTGSADGSGLGRAWLRDANRFGGGLPGGVVESSTESVLVRLLMNFLLLGPWALS